MQIPDAIEPAVGWRAWNVITGRPGSGEIFIGSVTQGSVWPHNRPMEAQCMHGHDPPGQSCSCGLYAATTRARLQKFGYHFFDIDEERLVIIGQVNLWGGIIPGNHGWRAQYGYPKKFFVPYSMWNHANALKTAYGIPVKLSNTFK